jgi:hypothetical protein
MQVQAAGCRRLSSHGPGSLESDEGRRRPGPSTGALRLGVPARLLTKTSANADHFARPRRRRSSARSGSAGPDVPATPTRWGSSRSDNLRCRTIDVAPAVPRTPRLARRIIRSTVVAPILTIAAAGWLGPSWLGIGATPTPTPTLGVTPCAIAVLDSGHGFRSGAFLPAPLWPVPRL